MAGKPFKNDVLDYGILFFGAGVFVGILGFSQPSAETAFIVNVLVGVFYATWGAWHHNRAGDLTTQVALEYAALGAFISVLLHVSLSG